MSDQIAVSCVGVGKTFRIPRSEERTLRGRLLHPLRGGPQFRTGNVQAVDELRQGPVLKTGPPVGRRRGGWRGPLHRRLPPGGLREGEGNAGQQA